MANPYILYGSYASYHTAKIRSYLLKKGIPFVERVPAVPRFRDYVRKESQNHRIPQLETPEGEVIQDSLLIFDALEVRHPLPAAWPPGIRQQLAARLLALLIDSTLGISAWHYRWNYKDEHYAFVGKEFGRSFRPQGDDAELVHYGDVIAERMEGKRAALGDSEALRPVFEETYLDALDILEQQFRHYPYLFGGLPSIADHILMGPLFGHLARDPVPAHIMKLRAPRVFRWTEHMNSPAISSPEHADIPDAYLENDDIPDSTRDFLALCVSQVSHNLLESVELYNKWAAASELKPGEHLGEEGRHEPVVARFEGMLRGVPSQESVQSYNIWAIQRFLDWRDSLDREQRAACEALLEGPGGAELMQLHIERRLTRQGPYMAFA